MLNNSMKLVVAAIISLAFLAGCHIDNPNTSEKQEKARTETMDRAHESVPMHRTQNFLTRETVVDFMERTDEPNKTFYIYVVADTGNVLGYYVARGRPVNICTFLTPPDRVERHRSNGIAVAVRSAPGIDGVYYGSNSCDSNYFFDAATDALVEIHGLKMFVADQPLELDAEPISVAAE